MSKTFVEKLFYWGPLWFGIGFLAPVLKTLMEILGFPPFSLSPLLIGLMIGAVWGITAKLRGRWI